MINTGKRILSAQSHGPKGHFTSAIRRSSIARSITPRTAAEAENARPAREGIERMNQYHREPDEKDEKDAAEKMKANNAVRRESLSQTARGISGKKAPSQISPAPVAPALTPIAAITVTMITTETANPATAGLAPRNDLLPAEMNETCTPDLDCHDRNHPTDALLVPSKGTSPGWKRKMGGNGRSLREATVSCATSVKGKLLANVTRKKSVPGFGPNVIMHFLGKSYVKAVLLMMQVD